MIDVITPEWTVPKKIHAFSTTRRGGFSQGPFNSLNLKFHEGDEPALVKKNREKLQHQFLLPTEPVWLNQVHGNQVIQAEHYAAPQSADAAYTTASNIICTVLTADCLPILLCASDGTEVASIHGGWRSLAADIIGETIKKFQAPPHQLKAWLGPAIGPDVFRVGDDVRDIFLKQFPATENAFTPSEKNFWLANIYSLAKERLRELGVNDISGGKYCTYSEPSRFFSYRRDGDATGRMATLIYISE